MTEQDPRAKKPGDELSDEQVEDSLPAGKDLDDEPELTIVLPAEGDEDHATSGQGVGSTLVLQPGGAGDFEEMDTSITRMEEGAFPRENSAEREDTEEVFVILPEQLGGDIPVVDTEAVGDFSEDDTERSGRGTERIGQGALSADAPPEWGVVDQTGLTSSTVSPETELAGQEATEIVEDDELDELAAELDDEALTAMVPEDEFEDGEGVHDDEFFGDEDDGGFGAQGARGRSWRLVVTLAATLLLAVTAAYFFHPALKSFLGGSDTAEAKVVKGFDSGNATGSNPGAGPDVDGTGGDTGGGEAGETATRRQFREQVLLALRLGYLGGEVANE